VIPEPDFQSLRSTDWISTLLAGALLLAWLESPRQFAVSLPSSISATTSDRDASTRVEDIRTFSASAASAEADGNTEFTDFLDEEGPQQIEDEFVAEWELQTRSEQPPDEIFLDGEDFDPDSGQTSQGQSEERTSTIVRPEEWARIRSRYHLAQRSHRGAPPETISIDLDGFDPTDEADAELTDAQIEKYPPEFQKLLIYY